VRYGRYGAFAQLGRREDEEKPKFASLRPHQRMDTISLEEAIELFQLPRVLGETDDGQPIKVAVGRFGPYVQFGPKKYVSLKKDDDPYTVTLERAEELIREKKEIDANRIIQDFAEEGIQVLNGRYGPYVTDGSRNGKIPKDRDPKTLTLDECKTILESAPVRAGRFGKKKTAAAAKQAPAKKKAATKKKARKKSAKKKTAKKKTAKKATATKS
jgi:DNA topoisomerase-1